MLEVLQYATSGFWTFIGCALLIAIMGEAAASVVIALVARCPCKGDKQ